MEPVLTGMILTIVSRLVHWNCVNDEVDADDNDDDDDDDVPAFEWYSFVTL